MNIGKTAKAKGTSAMMIRQCGQTGLIRPATRALPGCRVCSDTELKSLRFVRRAPRPRPGLRGQAGRGSSHPLARPDPSQRQREGDRDDHVAALVKKMQELKDMSDTLLHLASHRHGDDRPDHPIPTTLGSAEAVAPLPKIRDRRKRRAFGRPR